VKHYHHPAWLHALFALSALAIVALVGLAIADEAGRPTKLEQRIVPALGLVERCEQCHATDSHPGDWLTHHPVERFGCTPCHGGQGLGITKEEAHEAALDWERPLFSPLEREAACGRCHGGDEVPGAPNLSRGRHAFRERGCSGCHEVPGEPEPDLAPDLDGLAAKLDPAWVRAWLTDPAVLLPSHAMPRFALTADQIEVLVAFLFTRPAPSLPAVPEDSGDADRGKQAIARRRCATCHVLEGRGGVFAPSLDQAGVKIQKPWFFAYLQNVHALRPRSRMPGFTLPAGEAADMVAYAAEQLVPDTPEMPWSKFDTPVQSERAPEGHALFVKLGCRGCHRVEGLPPLKRTSVPLGNMGDKRAFDLPHQNFIDHVPDVPTWIHFKLWEPRGFDLPEAKPSSMPSYAHLGPDETFALGIAVASLHAAPLPSAYVRPARTASQALPAGETGRLVERFRCLACHRVLGSGGDISRVPLDGEGARTKPEWVASFLKEPLTLRMNQAERMPVLGIEEVDARRLAGWIDVTLGDDRIPPAPPPTEAERDAGAALYGARGCPQCHVVAGQGTMMKAPVLDGAGARLRFDYVLAMLRDGPAVVPARRHPDARLPEAEARAISAWVMSLPGRVEHAPAPQ